MHGTGSESAEVKVVVLGSGIVGLWTAEILSSRGHDVTVRALGSALSTTSAAAAAVITPLFPGRRDDPSFQRSIQWYRTTLERFTSLEEGAFIEWIPAFEFGITIDEAWYLEKDFRVDKFADVGLKVDYLRVDPSLAVENHVGDLQEITFGARFATPLCNSAVFLSWLESRLVQRGVRFHRCRINAIDQLRSDEADVYVNCLGFSSTELFPDPSVWAVRGQSMFIPVDANPAPHFGIAAGNHAVFKHGKGFYVGSYFIEGETNPRALPNSVEYHLSRTFTEETYPILCEIAGYEPQSVNLEGVTRVNSGVRPFRRGGPRIEYEVVDGLRVVHHYGHGAHGWTIGYGTALDAAALVETLGAR